MLNILVVEGTINYCGAKMCGYTNAHTFCRYSVRTYRLYNYIFCHRKFTTDLAFNTYIFKINNLFTHYTSSIP